MSLTDLDTTRRTADSLSRYAISPSPRVVTVPLSAKSYPVPGASSPPSPDPSPPSANWRTSFRFFLAGLLGRPVPVPPLTRPPETTTTSRTTTSRTTPRASLSPTGSRFPLIALPALAIVAVGFWLYTRKR